MDTVSGNMYDLGPDFSGGPEGVDRSLLAHCLTLMPTGWRDGWAVEFGTGSGETTRMIAEVLPVISFDSFEGLPEDWRPGFDKGRFAQFEMPTDIPGATIVPGWFADTAVGYDWPTYISLIHMDADLYSSTKTALESLEASIHPGTVVVFDEWFGYEGCEDHEQRAWREFTGSDTGEPWIEWEVIGHGREQWAIRITGVKA